MQQFISPAKVNFFLRVTGKRLDGYHELISLMSTVSLHDTLTIDFNASHIQVKCSHPQVPEDHTNLAYQAAKRFFQATDISDGVDICIEKCIPVGGGLGGGSSNAATVLMALNQWYRCPLSRRQLRDIALSLGADVPFFLHQKTALVSGVGEVLHPVMIKISHPLLIIYPGFPVSTAWVFKNLNLNLTRAKSDAIESIFMFEYKNSNVDWLSDIHNDLECVTFKKYPELLVIKENLTASGAISSIMSGSGSCIIGIFSDTNKCQKACEEFSKCSPQHAYVCHVLN